MTSEVEERARLITGGYGRHRSQWVNVDLVLVLIYTLAVVLLISVVIYM